ncbi:uncharacterized protein N7459_007637 [Penicillium hispanicum]|uniref:uncharacterized protein n=1 Tax=Penicillium hispanicum TaxID=1080232 RepID=UPI00253F760F|nr:uncharacterized protein N7459_007637 [Penicillium hispanicum]KAJ5578673.1 hypothetical protein N7459_007637 [Penicillium hispanicum]
MDPPTKPVAEFALGRFMRHYEGKERISYREAAKQVRDKCEEILQRHNINFSTAYREKAPDHLRERLENSEREHRRLYATPDEIEADNADIAAVCIMLHEAYDPGMIRELIRDGFWIKKEVTYPTSDKTKDGLDSAFLYRRIHYHVYLKEHGQSEEAAEVSKKLIELQVVRAVQGPWPETEHAPNGNASRGKLQKNIVLRHLTKNIEIVQDQNAKEDARAAEKEIAPFVDSGHVGNFVRKWIEKAPDGWYKKKDFGTPKALWLYLQSSTNTRQFLEQVLSTYLKPNSRPTYSKVAGRYPLTEVTVGVYLMDRILLLDNGRIAQTDSIEDFSNDNVMRIRILMSTIVWQTKLFAPELGWHWCFFDGIADRESLRESLIWLRSVDQDLFLKRKKPLQSTDIKNIDVLWDCFKNHRHGQVRLAFTMSRKGLLRQKEELEIVIGPLIHPLGVPS